MKNRSITRWSCLAVLIAFLASPVAAALEISTHELINEEAVREWKDAAGNNVLDEFLKQSLGLRDGLASQLRAASGYSSDVIGWIRLGGALEDEGSAFTGSGRFYRHFHDPLQPWNTAGLRARILGQHESSIRWMQNRDQSGSGGAGGNWSWHDARRMYYESLTEPDARKREALLAATFRALGHVMHLVADASNPDHARNDPHPLPSAPFIGTFFWNYDKWVQSQHDVDGNAPFIARFLSAPIGFDEHMLQSDPTGDSVANDPIARLLDTDRYTGANAEVTLTGEIGIAEIANANFFSENTLTGEYPSPAPGTHGLIRTQLALPRRTPDGRHLVRRYWTRPGGQGLLPVNPLRAECAGGGGAGRPRPYPCVDEAVWNATAGHMLPRAVGYARGVLDYFFRGSVRVRRVTSNAAGLWIDIENTSREPMTGVFELYARHQKGTDVERRAKLTTLNGGTTIALGPGATLRASLSLPDGDPLPYYVMVFRGSLGSENDAVVGHVFAVPHVRIVEQSYDADISKACTTVRFSQPDSGLGSSQILLDERILCSRQMNDRVEGRLLTNFGESDPAAAQDPAIDRIEALWVGGSAPGHARLTIGGVEHLDGIWKRQGDEQNPETFLITDPQSRTDSQLWVLVSVRGTEEVFSAPMAVFADITPWGVARKTLLRVHSEYVVEALRTTHLVVNAPAARFTIVSIGGFPMPTFRSRPNDTVVVGSSIGTQTFRDVRQTFPLDSKAAADAAYSAIELQVIFPQPPDMHWGALVTPKPFDAAASRFWRTFVASEDPPEEPIVLRGHDAEAVD